MRPAEALHQAHCHARARETFDLDAAFASLPPDSPGPAPSASVNGAAGRRLQAHLRADIPDELLREAAKDILGAGRCSADYLEALRVVLGNQADAERRGYVLELNQRVPFATPRTMRTIIDQLESTGLTFGRVVTLGGGKSQEVQCYGRARMPSGGSAEADLEELHRQSEDADWARLEAAIREGRRPPDSGPGRAAPEDVPY